MNNLNQGVAMYESAIDYFSHKPDYSHLSRAYYFYGVEMLRYDIAKGLKLINEAESVARRNGIKDVLFIIEKNRQLLSEAAKKR
jgi:hypothetical protein